MLEDVGLVPQVANLISEYAAEFPEDAKPKMIKAERYRMLNQELGLCPISFSKDYFVQCLGGSSQESKIFHLNRLGELKEFGSKQIQHRYLLDALFLTRSGNVERFVTLSDESIIFWDKESKFDEKGRLILLLKNFETVLMKQ